VLSLSLTCSVGAMSGGWSFDHLGLILNSLTALTLYCDIYLSSIGEIHVSLGYRAGRAGVGSKSGIRGYVHWKMDAVVHRVCAWSSAARCMQALLLCFHASWYGSSRRIPLGEDMG